ncbi:MAG: hypothetical protein IMZ44_14905, partial [Planctomycetes bacterium]|nr:hypothetical protein [Planctomycetota bacterium]
MATRMLLGASPAQRKNQALDYEEQQRRLLGNPGQAAVQGDYNAQVAQEARYNVPQTVQPGLQGIYPHLTDQGRAVAAAGASQSAVLPYGGGSLPGTVAGTGEMAGGAAAAGAAERNRRMTTAEAAAAATYTAPPQTATPWDAKAMQRIVAESAQSRALQASGGGVMMTGPANNTTARIVGGPTPAPDLRTQANMLPLQTGVAAGHAMLQGTRAAGNMAESGGNLAVARNQADQGAVARTTETATRRGEIVNEGLGQDVRGAGLRNDMAGQDLRIRTDQANINPAMLNEGLLGARNQNRVGTAGAGVAERQAKAIGSLTDPQLTQGMGLTPSPASAQQANADRIAQQMSDMRMSAAAEPDPERRAEMLRQIEQMNQAMISAQGMEAVQE